MTQTPTKEHPIIFSGPMVRAIPTGQKTQTRRTQGLDRLNQEPDCWYWAGVNKFKEHVFYPTDLGEKKYPNYYPEDFSGLIKCPFGQPGDRLWVRETFVQSKEVAEYGAVYYREEMSDSRLPKHLRKVYRWKPSIHMPRGFSRITLEVLWVRVERLQDISEEDAIAEGSQIPCAELPKSCQQGTMTEREQFLRIFDSLNARRGYGREKNPQVWVIGFKEL